MDAEAAPAIRDVQLFLQVFQGIIKEGKSQERTRLAAKICGSSGIFQFHESNVLFSYLILIIFLQQKLKKFIVWLPRKWQSYLRKPNAGFLEKETIFLRKQAEE